MTTAIRPLRDVLRDALAGSLPDGWVYLPEGPLAVATPCLLVTDDGGATDDRGVPLSAVEQGFPREGLDAETVSDTARCAQLITDPPSDALLLESFRYYLEHDVFLPRAGAPPPPSGEETGGQAGRDFYDDLGPERQGTRCREDGCTRGTVAFSTRCRTHHFESVLGRACPFAH
jgi:hypothetical protein